jgi:hypothetical protein
MDDCKRPEVLSSWVFVDEINKRVPGCQPLDSSLLYVAVIGRYMEFAHLSPTQRHRAPCCLRAQKQIDRSIRILRLSPWLTLELEFKN